MVFTVSQWNYVTGSTQGNNVLTLINNSGGTTTYTPNAATGGTYSNGTISLLGSGTLSSITGLSVLSADTYVTGGTANNSSKLYTFTNNTGGTFSVTSLTDLTITAGTYNNQTGTATFTNSTGGTFTVAQWNYVTGSTQNNNLLTLGNNSGGTTTYTPNAATGGTYSNGIITLLGSGTLSNITGIPNVFVTGGTPNNSSLNYLFTNNTGGTFTVAGLTDVRVTGGTYSSGTAVFTNNTGGTFNVTGFSTSGGSGADTYVTGGTANNSSKLYTFTNNTGGTFNVTGLTDLVVTGGTYSSGTAVFTNNTGGTFNVTGFNTGGGLTYSEITATTVNLSGNTGYILNNASQLVATLPLTASVGDIIRITGKGAGGWKVAQNASQVIHFLDLDTLTGTGGSIASSTRRDAIDLQCVVINNEWNVIDSIGNIIITT